MSYHKEFERAYCDICPPLEPVRRKDRLGCGLEYWDPDTAFRKLCDEFPNRGFDADCSFIKESLGELAKIVETQLSQRFQLSYEAHLEVAVREGEYSPSIEVRFPSLEEAGYNNRFYHSIKVAHAAVRIGRSVGLAYQDLFLLAEAGLMHDFMHPVLSHTGDRFLRSARQFAEEDRDFRLMNLMDYVGLGLSHEKHLWGKLDINSEEYNPLAVFIYQNNDRESREKLKKILKEEGALGKVLKLADTAAYLDHDSVYEGYEAPDFVSYITGGNSNSGSVLKINGDSLQLRDDKRGKEVLSSLLSYREFMYKNHYVHPFNMLIEKMQQQTLMAILRRTKKGIPRFNVLKLILSMSDSECIQMMRRVAIERMGDEEFQGALVFLGIPFVEYGRIENGFSTEVKDSGIEIKTGGYDTGKTFEVLDSAGKEIAVRPVVGKKYVWEPGQFEFFVSDKMVFYPSSNLLNKLGPLFDYLCEGEKISSKEAVDFLKKIYVLGVNDSKNLSVEDRETLEEIKRLLNKDFTVSYSLRRIFEKPQRGIY